MAAVQPGAGYGYTYEVFGNDLVFSHIANYLEIPDLKILRQTCKLFLFKVNGNRRFSSNVLITISNEAMKDFNIMNGTLEWRNTRIVINHTSAKHFPKIRTDYIEELQLFLPPLCWYTYLGKGDCTWKSRSACYKFLESSQLTHLRILVLELTMLSYDIPMSALIGVVGMVKDFRLTCHFGYFMKELAKIAQTGQVFLKNWEMIAGLGWKLESFAIGKSDVEWLFFASMPLFYAPLGSILASSSSTLETIKIFNIGFQIREMIEIQVTQFPRLRDIDIRLNEENTILFVEFLNLQPHLESIQITTWYDVEMADILGAIRRNVSSKLHTLRLCGLIYSYTPRDPNAFAFLRNLKELKDVAIHDWCFNHTDLPASVQSVDFSLQDSLFPQSSTALLSALPRFSNLVQLKIIVERDEGAGDDMLQCVCKNLTRLRMLHFAYVGLTDFGLTGEKGNSNSGVSLRCLKGLRELRIFCCKMISTEGLVKSIQFLELRVLKLGINLPHPALLEIAFNNPSLEFVAHRRGWPPPDMRDYRKLFYDLLPINPRLTNIRTTRYWPDGYINSEDEHYEIFNQEFQHRPSYGVSVSATLSNEATLDCLRKRMKIVFAPVNDSHIGVSYYCSARTHALATRGRYWPQ